ncbi:MAG: mechanosensitive ion channel family protein [Acidaminococcaceae bacterium]|nr:mechanosensitive ion channel family protein [Acidaminococcaceae bacterium]
MDTYLSPLTPWLPAICTMAAFTAARYLYKLIVIKILRNFTGKLSLQRSEEILDAFEAPINVFLYVYGLYIALNISPLAASYKLEFLDHILRSTIVLTVFWGFYNLSGTTHMFFLDVLSHFGIQTESAVSNIISTILRFLIICMCFLTVAKEWNYDITGFIASLSIGSLAVAFAAKDALANIFGSLIILIDKPFKTGDLISANGVEGVVENISLRSTCVRTLSQELVYIPNSLLSNTPITNHTNREKRCVDFVLGLTYNTTREQMERILNDIRHYLQAQDFIYSDAVRVNFLTYGDSSLNIRITFYVYTSVTAEYFNYTEQVNLELMKIMQAAGVSCAFPSTSIYFETPLESK